MNDAFNDLLAYAECEEASHRFYRDGYRDAVMAEEFVATLRRHGWGEETVVGSFDFIRGLRRKALAKAKGEG